MKGMNLLESYFIKDGKTHKKFHSLSEADQKVVSKTAVNKLFQSIKSKSLKINYMGIESSKGDITKFSKYEDLANSIKILENMYKSDTQNAPKEINTLVRTLDVLKKYTPDFQKSFSENNELLTMLYTNIVAAMVGSTAMLISTTIDYMKDPMGNYKAIFKNKKAVQQDVYVKSLERFLNMEIKGDLKKLFKSKLNESSELEGTSEHVLSEDFGIAFLVIAIVFLVIFIIRDIVFIYYYAGAKIAENLLVLAYFLEQSAYNLDTSSDKDKKVFEKQIKTVEKLKRMADKILSSNKDSAKTSNKEKEKEDKDTSTLDGNSVLV